MTEAPKINKRVTPRAMLNKRAAFAYIDGVAIVVSSIDKWDDKMVLEFIEEQAKAVGYISAVVNITHFFGEVFGASHRKLIVDWIGKNNLTASARTALVTDSAIMRAALTAYSWLTKTEGKAFDTKSRDAMCAWAVQNTSVNAAEVKKALEDCYKLIGK